ncbi:unnamed protein product [Fraxinus pennsylvanica]|uniref:F-box domain-containing protein n=1 Tax=Fraxinus pennsylvanica TaxID=56036 RepID=A0AAD2EBJ9_9LAMI|nr:unnamed protein product [Fraxinus pennsylvanica]
MNELPVEILVEVLSRLPYKSLCRFTCVSKEWHSLISSPDPGLVKDLRHRLHPNPYLYIWDFNKYFDDDRLTLRLSIVDIANERIQENHYLPYGYSNFYYLVSCHNFICFVGSMISIHNLSTQETAVVPDTVDYGDVGFGYSSLSNEYKVVKWFMQDAEGISMGCKIFSLSDRLTFKSDSWRLTETRPFEDLSGNPASVNGVIYWLMYTQNHPNFYQMDSILATDLDKEESEIISCPELSPSTRAYLLELKECLYLAHCSSEKAIVEMWRLEDPKNCVWVSEYYINLSSIRYAIVPLTSVLVGHVEKLVFIPSGGRALLYYNVETGTMSTPDNLVHLKQHRLELPCVLKYMEF